MLEAIPPDLWKPLLDEFRRGWHKEQVIGRIEQKKFAAKAKEYHRGVDGLGRLRARIPASSFHYWGQRLGYQCWQDETFLKEFIKENDLEVKGGSTKLQVGYKAPQSSISILDQFGRPAA
jgi:hypothetical protein